MCFEHGRPGPVGCERIVDRASGEIEAPAGWEEAAGDPGQAHFQVGITPEDSHFKVKEVVVSRSRSRHERRFLRGMRRERVRVCRRGERG